MMFQGRGTKFLARGLRWDCQLFGAILAVFLSKKYQFLETLPKFGFLKLFINIFCQIERKRLF